ncbi:MAG: nucleotide-binding protein [Acidiferrobacterales bacterium]
MRKIMVLNTKGGSGKTMLATNLAAYYAQQGKKVALADLDEQASSLAWLESRPEELPEIIGISGAEGSVRAPRDTDILILDTPAASYGKDMGALVRRAQTIIIPVQSSATDMRAAGKFVQALLEVGKVTRREVRLALVANRLRQRGALETLLSSIRMGDDANRTLIDFLEHLKIPLIAKLEDSEAYLEADAQGKGIFELGDMKAVQQQILWRPLLEWLDSRRSIPRVQKQGR